MATQSVARGDDLTQPNGEGMVSPGPNLVHAMLRPASFVGGRNPNVNGRDPVLRAVADR
jgi:hypothetical protein